MKVKVYNIKGEAVSDLELSKDVFGVKWNPELIHQVVYSVQSNKRQGTAHAKPRSDVRGGGRKPWRQKGTGRARHGSSRSPIWVGGGVTHGPLKDKNYSKTINKKMKKAALHSLLSKKAQDGEIIIVEEFSFAENKTKQAAILVQAFEKKKIIEPKKSKLVLLASETMKEMEKIFRNLPKVKVMESRNINILDAINNKYLIFTKQSIHGSV
ncbi:50S ribosomal protein L4 [Patescibacteria group bacterium]